MKVAANKKRVTIDYTSYDVTFITTDDKIIHRNIDTENIKAYMKDTTFIHDTDGTRIFVQPVRFTEKGKYTETYIVTRSEYITWVKVHGVKVAKGEEVEEEA